MTAIIGIHLRDYILVAADVRETLVERDRLTFRDNAQKIHETLMGLVVSAGSANLIHPVWRRLEKLEHLHWSNVVAIIREEQIRLGENLDVPRHERDKAIETTCWMMTARSQSDGRLRLLVSLGDHEGKIVENDIFFMTPIPKSYEELKSLLRPMGNNEGIEESFRYHAHVVRRFIAESAEESEFVSPEFRVAVHREDGGFNISHVTMGEDLEIIIQD